MKRDEQREDYTYEEKKYLLENFVKKLSGNPRIPPGWTLADVTASFNRRFPNNQRSEGGIGGIMDRVKEQYERLGDLEIGPGRGHNKKAEAAARRAMGEVSDEPPRKKTKTGGDDSDSESEEESEDEDEYVAEE